MAAVPFSYAQAAKGKSSIQKDVANDPMLSSLDPVANWAQDDTDSLPTLRRISNGAQTQITHAALSEHSDAQQSAPSNIAAPSSNLTPTEGDLSSKHNGEADAIWENKSHDSTTGDNVNAATTGLPAVATNDAGEAEDKPTPSSLKEAPLPTVNFWTQRARVSSVKPIVSPQPMATASKAFGPSSKSGNAITAAKDNNAFSVRQNRTHALSAREPTATVKSSPSQDWTSAAHSRNKSEGSGLASRLAAKRNPETEQRVPIAAKQHKTQQAVIPLSSIRDTTSWPTPDSAQEDDRRKSHDKGDKTEPDRSAVASLKPHGRNEWVPVPITPSFKYDTQFHGPSKRGGRGTTRGAKEQSTRGDGSGNNSNGRSSQITSSSSNESRNDPRSQDNVETYNDVRSSSLPPKSQRPVNGVSRATAPAHQSKRPTLPDAASRRLNREIESAIVSQTIKTSSDGHSNQNFNRPNGVKAASVLPQTQRKSGVFGQADDHHVRANQTSTHGSGPASHPIRHESHRRSEPSHGTNGHFSNHVFDQYHEHGNPSTSRDGWEGRFDRPRGNKSGRASYLGGTVNGSNPQLSNGHSISPIDNGSVSTTTSNLAPSYHSTMLVPQNSRPSAPRQNAAQKDTTYSRQHPLSHHEQPTLPPPMSYDYSGSQQTAPLQYDYLQMQMLYNGVANQLNYYFSLDNLCKDLFLRKHMNSQGFVPLSLIAGFTRMKHLTTDLAILKQIGDVSPDFELRSSPDGSWGIRTKDGWEQWVLPIDERESLARTDGIESKDKTSNSFQHQSQKSDQLQHSDAYPRVPLNLSSQPFSPISTTSPITESSPFQLKSSKPSPTKSSNTSYQPLNLTAMASNPIRARQDDELDVWPDDKTETLTVVLRNQAPEILRSPHERKPSPNLTMGSRPAITNRSEPSAHESDSWKGSQVAIEEEMLESVPAGLSTPADLFDRPVAAGEYWIKGKDRPEPRPADSDVEPYPVLHARALQQRSQATQGICPYDMDVLYQFWSNFLVRNFNTRLYEEFRHLALSDAATRSSQVGLTNLIKYYGDSLASQQTVRYGVAEDYVQLVKAEDSQNGRSAFKNLRSAWRNGALNMKNRKRISDFIDPSLRAELDDH